jgi:hypothetical protein
VPREHARLDWATNDDESIGPVPTPSDFRPTKARSPLASPEPAPRLLGNHFPPPQPVHTTRNRVVTPPWRNGTPHAHTPATDAPTTPRARTPFSPTKYPAPIMAPHRVPTERAPTAIVHGPRDLSVLRSDTRNPWGSLRCRHNGRYARVPRQFARQKQYPPIYPANTHLHTTPTPKPPTPAHINIFETVRHPHGIGPTKPVIRTPVSLTGDTLAPHSQPRTAQPLSPALPPLPARPTGTVQCRCGQLVRVSPASEPLQIPTTQLQPFCTFPIHISNFRVLFKSFSLPSLFFSCFSFPMATRALP